jgi:hypothetical protein
MDKPINPITKTCSICGQQKPLAAFLQLSGNQGSSYGIICSTCRQAGLDKQEKVKESEDSTRSTTSKTIDNKAKMQVETDTKQQLREIEEQYFEEREENSELQSEHSEKKQNIAKSEKTHRENYLEKRSFLDSTDKAKRNAASLIFGGEEQKAREGAIRLDAPVLDTQIAGKLKYQGSVFNQFKTWLGTSAPIVKATQSASQKAGQNKKAGAKEVLVENVEKTWGPKRTR